MRAGLLRDGEGGLSDGSVEGAWRLPTKNELHALVNGNEPVRYSTPRAFVGVQFYYYWSSTTTVFSTDSAWSVYLVLGSYDYHNKSFIWYVWPVRGGN